jgi:hypothetical protein
VHAQEFSRGSFRRALYKPNSASFGPVLNEQDLVSRYSAGLDKNKVVLESNELWSQYRLFSAAGYIMAIVASVLVKQTDRGDLMFAAMANRHGQQMIDLESEKLYV